MDNKGNTSLPIKYDQLVLGYEFPPARYELNLSFVSKYLEATGEQDSLTTEFVPPLAIAAYNIAAMSGVLSLPPGVIHASQDLEFLKLVPIGAEVESHNRVAQKLDRGKMHLLAIEFDVFDQDAEKVLAGKATLVLSD